MKMFIVLLTLAMSFASIASSGETKTFVYDGSQNSVELLLRGDKTHTEYRYEQRHTTCTRTEVDYRTVCDNGGIGHGPNGPVRIPPRCHSQPYYRTVYYPCIQTVSIPYEVKDYDVEARVIVDVKNLSETATPGETFRVTLDGDSLALNVVGSKRFFVMLKNQDVRSSMNGSVKFLDAVYATELIEAAPVLNALSMTKISIKDSLLKVAMGHVTSTEFLGFSLYVEKRVLFGSDKVLFDRELALSEIEISAGDAGSSLGINVEKLGLKLSGGKFEIQAKAFFKAPGKLLNKSEFDALDISRTLIYTNR